MTTPCKLVCAMNKVTDWQFKLGLVAFNSFRALQHVKQLSLAMKLVWREGMILSGVSLNQNDWKVENVRVTTRIKAWSSMSTVPHFRANMEIIPHFGNGPEYDHQHSKRHHVIQDRAGNHHRFGQCVRWEIAVKCNANGARQDDHRKNNVFSAKCGISKVLFMR